MIIRTRAELDDALWRVFVEAIADEPTEPLQALRDEADTDDGTREASGEPERELVEIGR